MKSAGAVKREAASLAMMYAREREKTGDPEGAGEFRDLARSIRAIVIREKPRNSPWRD